MAWQPEKTAGFALAALLAGDRELAQVAAALDPVQYEALQAALPRNEDREVSVRRLLCTLRPALDEGAALLPPRLRALVARLSPAPVQKLLLRGTPPTRAHFNADPVLLQVLARIARNACQARRP